MVKAFAFPGDGPDYVSTDLAYSRCTRQELEEAALALNKDNIKAVTAVTLTPDRMLYNACLCASLLNFPVHAANEIERGKETANNADRIYGAVIDNFHKKLPGVEKEIATQKIAIRHYAEHLHRAAGEEGQGYNQKLHELTTGVNNRNLPEDWMRLAGGCYRDLKVQFSVYRSSISKTIPEMIRFWCERNVESDFYRRAADGVIEDYIGQILPKSDRIRTFPPSERKMVVFTGPIGAGKSTMRDAWLEHTPESYAVLDADSFNYGLFRKAVDEGKIPKTRKYDGREVHNEGTNAVRTLASELAFKAKTGMPVPNLVMEMTSFGYWEDHKLEEALAGGSSVEVHNITMSPREAIRSAKRRAGEIGRLPTDQSIEESCRASAHSIVRLAGIDGAHVVAYLYDRKAYDSPPVYSGVLDVEKKSLFIENPEGFRHLAERADPERKKDGFKNFIDHLLDEHVTLYLTDPQEHHQVLASLAKEGVDPVLRINPGAETRQKAGIAMLKPYAQTCIVGDVVYRQTIPDHRLDVSR